MKKSYRIFFLNIILILLLGLKVYAKYNYTYILKAYKLTIDNTNKKVEEIISSNEVENNPTTVQIITNKNNDNVITNETESTELNNDFVIQILR